MAEDDEFKERVRGVKAEPVEDGTPEVPLVSDREYEEASGEDIRRTLDISTWPTGVDWEGAIERLKGEIRDAVAREDEMTANIRAKVLPQIAKMPNRPPEAGVYSATPDEIRKIHEGYLFPGLVEAVDGTAVTHETLPLGVTQIGIAVVSYGGTAATFAQRVYRKELAGRSSDAYEKVLDFIQKRKKSDPREGGTGKVTELLRRGIMTYAEREILLDRSTAEWRIGHGNPIAYELLTGAGQKHLLAEAIPVLRRLILDFKKFVFVPSTGDRAILTIGNALLPGEYAVLDPLTTSCLRVVEEGHYSAGDKDKARAFVEECAPHVLVGVFRAAADSPPYVFYAHREHVHMAARIAIADSVLRPTRGFPMLIDVADMTCGSAFGAGAFLAMVHDAYTQAGAPLRYFSERDTRG